MSGTGAPADPGREPRAEGAWRLLDTPPASGAWNMAVDEVLMASVREGSAPTLRFYRWSPACLSFGRNQPARGHYDPEALRAAGVAVVRRPTGGRAVLHDAELTYAVVAPVRALGTPRAAYRAINRALVAGLARLGAAAAVQGPGGGRSPVPSLAPCFAEPVEGEVLAGGRKLIGSAQLCEEGVLLQHGALPLRAGGSARALAERHAFDDGDPAYLEAVLGRVVPWDRLAAGLAEAWAAHIAPLERGTLTPAERASADLRARNFEDPAWTWRR